MILQALYQYYQRCQEAVPATGFQNQKIPFLIHLDTQGQFIQFSDTREKVGSKKMAKTFWVPTAVRRTNKILPNLLWDKPEYVLGISPASKPPRKIEDSRKAFLEKTQALANHHPEIQSLKLVLSFLKDLPMERLQADPLFQEVTQGLGSVLTFQILGQSNIVCAEPEVIQAILTEQADSSNQDSNEQGICLITGQSGKIARLHPVIQGITGGLNSGSSLVACNLQTAWSHGKTQGYNAPVSEAATHAYTTALNQLLHPDSRQKLHLAGTTVAFWAETETKPSREFEDQFAAFFAEENAHPHSQGTAEIQKLYQSPWHGCQAILEQSDESFCILGLSVNTGSRIAVQFWHVLPIRVLAQTLSQHFEDLALVHAPQESGHLPIKRLLKELCPEQNLAHLSPSLENALFESILLGTPYPLRILQKLVLHIQSVPKGGSQERPKINYPQAAFLKAFLNRYHRRYGLFEKELTVSLDETNSGIGYCLGRLFAVLEKIQKDGQGITTLRERFYAAASTRPVVAFPHLLSLKNHHLNKMSSLGVVVFYEKLLARIMSHFTNGFPTQLTLFEQGAFAVGYYHQQQALYTKTESIPDFVSSPLQLELEGVLE